MDGGFFTTFFSAFVVSSAAIAVAAKAIETAAANAAPRQERLRMNTELPAPCTPPV